MLRFTRNEIGVCQGELGLVADFDTQGPMWTDEGEREIRSPVKYSERFLMPPAVQLSASMWDLDSSRNLRGNLRAENVTASGFDAVFQTWGDTRVARLTVTWMAIGVLPDEQDFTL